MEIQLKTLTPLWTGGVDQTCDRLHETGLIGSLRWWYEAIVRGLGGNACDPTSEGRCPDQGGRRCTACELFGCTGWARKFRLRILDEHNQIVQTALKANLNFRLQFLELRERISDEEKWLLAKTIEIAAQYGSLGGKTTLKPQAGKVGEDYGIVQMVPIALNKPNIAPFFNQHRRVTFENAPDLRWFFFVKGAYLKRQQMNELLGLNDQGRPTHNPKSWQKFLQGRRGSSNEEAVSKKLFSFRADGGRIWGYAQDAHMRDTIIAQIRKQLGSAVYTAKTGEEVLNEL